MKKLKISSRKKQINQLEEWFNGMGISHVNRVIWCKDKDGNGFSDGKTSELHERLEAVNYVSIPKTFDGGYVVNYRELNNNKFDIYKDPWTGNAIIDPADPLNELTEDEMALLSYGIKIDNIQKPVRKARLESLLKQINKFGDGWDEIKELFDALKASEQASYVEGVYWEEKKSFSTAIGRSLQVIDDHYDSTGGGWNSKLIKNVTEDDILKVLQLNWRHSDAPLDALVNNLQCDINELKDKLHKLKEKEWVTLNLTDMGTGGEISLTSSGRKLKFVSPKEITDIYQKRINAIRKDLARETDGERKVILKAKLQDVLADQKEHGQQDDPVTMAHKRRLHELKKKQALSGFNTSVDIILEIEDIEKKLGY